MPTQPQPTLPTADFSDRPLLCHPQDPFAAERQALLAEIKEKEEFAQKTTDLCEAQDVRILNLEKVSRPWRFFWGASFDVLLGCSVQISGLLLLAFDLTRFDIVGAGQGERQGTQRRPQRGGHGALGCRDQGGDPERAGEGGGGGCDRDPGGRRRGGPGLARRELRLEGGASLLVRALCDSSISCVYIRWASS